MKKLLVALFLLFPFPALGADNYTVNTAAGTNTTLRATDDGTAKIPHVMLSPGVPAITSSSGNVANVSAVATLAGTATTTAHISGFQCTGGGATAASLQTVTVAGVVTGTMSYTVAVPAGATAGMVPLVVGFVPAVPASAVNTSIVVTMPALGAGNTNATCSAQGYRN